MFTRESVTRPPYSSRTLIVSNFVDNVIANIRSGGEINLENYYTKEETYNKEKIENLIPTVTDGKDGVDGQDGFSPAAAVIK